MISVVIITDNQYFVMGVVDCLYRVFNASFVNITCTNFENYQSSLRKISAEPTVFIKNLILCESSIFNILNGDVCTSRYRLIDISKSVEHFYHDLLTDSDLRLKGCVSYLTPKEYDLCRLFKRCCTDDEIIADLKISKKTLSCHRRNILSKLKLKNKQQLYVFCKTL